ncbi:nucleopolyhedrovirus P10 family protein [Streptomyces roseirectus]|uniref:Nucleopolyhedrovirus P10 family protein n=1 Tax=Streptomyces roseirectus TaxID=2768066 RepID=A0A7H0IL19_9ACTN|nr:nucleopolyhedrovirus P10 family protein [Streptomyces roseirectus]QNP73485.1 nucleopolyhedrovirus P10 family protein [Streptomyces roseirectus]
MTAEQHWRQTVRHHLGLGRYLPLGGPRDGCWIAESAAETALRRALAGQVSGVRLGPLRLSLTDPQDAPAPVVPPPASALPPGPLRLSAEFSSRPTDPLPTAAARLRAALAAATSERVGLVVTEIDLHVTGPLDDVPEPEGDPEGALAPLPAWTGPQDDALAGVPGVLGGTVHNEERAGTQSLPGLHARVELAVRVDLRILDVARAARAAVQRLPGSPTAAVLVTAVG